MAARAISWGYRRCLQLPEHFSFFDLTGRLADGTYPGYQKAVFVSINAFDLTTGRNTPPAWTIR